jgi:glycosyltransferase involved in cell wall biosynthesis
MAMHSNEAPKRRAVILTADHEVDRRILQQNRDLVKAGWDVFTYCPNERAGGSKIADEDIQRSNFGLFYSLYHLFLRFVGTGEIASVIKRIIWRLLSGLPWFLEKFHSLGVDRLRGMERPTLVIAHDLPMLPLGVQLARYFSCRLIYDSHEFYSGQIMPLWESWAWRWLERKYIKHADAVITVNPSIAELIEIGYGLEKVHVVQNAVDRSQDDLSAGDGNSLRAALGISFAEKILLYQGGLSSGRNLHNLVLSLKLVKTNGVKLVFLGGGELYEDLIETVKENDLEGKVLFHSRVSQEMLSKYTLEGDVGVIPYLPNCLNNKLCTPNKLYEFIAAGVPVLSSDLKEVKRILYRYGCGFTVDMDSPSAIAAGIDDIFADPATLSDIKANARAASAQVNWKNEGAVWMGIVETVMHTTDSLHIGY